MSPRRGKKRSEQTATAGLPKNRIADPNCYSVRQVDLKKMLRPLVLLLTQMFVVFLSLCVLVKKTCSALGK